MFLIYLNSNYKIIFFFHVFLYIIIDTIYRVDIHFTITVISIKLRIFIIQYRIIWYVVGSVFIVCR